MTLLGKFCDKKAFFLRLPIVPPTQHHVVLNHPIRYI